jgi:hypothetical protein
MNGNQKAFGLIVVGLSCVGASAKADANAPVEGTYAAQCERITLTAGIFESSCESDPSSLICGAQWLGTPYVAELEACAPGDLSKSFAEVYQECRAQSDLVLSVDGVSYDVEHDVCTAAATAYTQLAPSLEDSVNGSFGVEVAGTTWISTMSGRFESDSGGALSLNYATANFPWSSLFRFGTVAGVPSSLGTAACGNTSLLFSAVSDGTIHKTTGDLSLNYNLNGTFNCQVGPEAYWTATVNLHVDVAGERLD